MPVVFRTDAREQVAEDTIGERIYEGLYRICFMQPEKFRAPGIGPEDFDRMSVAHGHEMARHFYKRATKNRSVPARC